MLRSSNHRPSITINPFGHLLGPGFFPRSKANGKRRTSFPKGADWIQDSVAELQPEQNCVVTQSGNRITYDFLVVALGIQIDWNKIPGLVEGVGRQQICSNYSYQQVDYTWKCVSNFKGGTAASRCRTQPSSVAVLRRRLCISPMITFANLRCGGSQCSLVHPDKVLCLPWKSTARTLAKSRGPQSDRYPIKAQSSRDQAR